MPGVDRKIQIEAVPPGRYRVIFEGKEIGVWRDPTFAAARYLLEHGLASREDTLRTYWGDMLSMRGSVGWYAKHRVQEGDKVPLRVVKWRPSPFASSRQE